MAEVALQQYEALELGQAADAIAATLAGALVGLTKAQVAVNRSTTKAALEAVKCTYTGYAPEVITWGIPTRADDGVIEVVGSVGVFAPTDAAAPNDAWAVYIYGAAAGPLMFAAQFPGAPLPMQSALDQITILVRYRPATGSIAVVVS